MEIEIEDNVECPKCKHIFTCKLSRDVEPSDYHNDRD